MTAAVLTLAAGCSVGDDLTIVDTTAPAVTSAGEGSPTAEDVDEGGDEPSASPTGTDPASTSTATATATPAPEPRPEGCPAGNGPFTLPDDAVFREVIDVDADGIRDRAWVATEGPVTRIGILTSAGGGSSIDFTSASPLPRAAMVMSATGRLPAQLVVSDGRLASLFVYLDCEIQAVRNREGNVYQFSLGVNEFGTGVGCAVVGGQPQLVGLNITGQTETTVSWSRTVIELTGATAQNGRVDQGQFTKGVDDDAIALLSTIACGSDVIETFGLTEPQG